MWAHLHDRISSLRGEAWVKTSPIPPLLLKCLFQAKCRMIFSYHMKISFQKLMVVHFNTAELLKCTTHDNKRSCICVPGFCLFLWLFYLELSRQCWFFFPFHCSIMMKKDVSKIFLFINLSFLLENLPVFSDCLLTFVPPPPYPHIFLVLSWRSLHFRNLSWRLHPHFLVLSWSFWNLNT